MYKFPNLRDAKVKGQKVFLRADLDVPLSQQTTNNNQQSTIEDDTRLKDSLSTIEYLLKKGATVFIAGHLGRPTKQFSILNFKFSKTEKEFNLKPIVSWFSRHFNDINHYSEIPIGKFYGWKISDHLFLLDNLRFYDGEEKNDPEFCEKLASLADIYVNDAFAVSHRSHASIVGVAKLLPHFAGFRLKKEVESLGNILENPKRPLVVIVGGAKIETKLPVVEKMHQFADYVLVGGKIAEEVKTLLKVQHEKVNPPGGRKSVLLVADLSEKETDITSKDLENFLQIINLAKTIVWNGPIDKILTPPKVEQISNSSSAKLAGGIIGSGAYTVVGGGDTLGLLRELNLLNKFSFVSTGGGAMLEFLSGGKLPGIEALTSP